MRLEHAVHQQIRTACLTSLSLAEFEAQSGDYEENVDTKKVVNLEVKHFQKVTESYLGIMDYMRNIYGVDDHERAKEDFLRAQSRDEQQGTRPNPLTTRRGPTIYSSNPQPQYGQPEQPHPLHSTQAMRPPDTRYHNSYNAEAYGHPVQEDISLPGRHPPPMPMQAQLGAQRWEQRAPQYQYQDHYPGFPSGAMATSSSTGNQLSHLPVEKRQDVLQSSPVYSTHTSIHAPNAGGLPFIASNQSALNGSDTLWTHEVIPEYYDQRDN
ncbi:putative aaa family atpase protein [Seiridium unicorne]|uniref:Aaa family atpase protein n=1 Tax=Seiridium unicorne TaxID=138068 RepID=A0ABR2UVY8_9PEZI